MESGHTTLSDSLRTTAMDLQKKLELLQQWQQPRIPMPPPSGGAHGLHVAPKLNSSQEELMRLALQGVIRHAGIQPTESMRSKLERLLNDPTEKSHLQLLVLNAQGPEGWQKLVEKLTVHETYFYRDRSQMEMIQKDVLSPLIRSRKGQARPSLRIWSAATSTGEEAYTLTILAVMELLAQKEATLLPNGEVQISTRWHVEVTGSDISHRALETAMKGRYLEQGALNPFREMPPEMRRFFDFKPHGHETAGHVRESLRRLVDFRHHNLTSGPFAHNEVDLLLCRNVMIYFDEPTRYQVQTRLFQALRPGGFLVLGPSDTLLLSSGFKTRWGDKAVLHQKE